MRYMYIGKDSCGNYAIKAYDEDNRRTYGARWNGAISYLWYSKKEAEKAFRAQFGLQRKHFIKVDCGAMW